MTEKLSGNLQKTKTSNRLEIHSLNSSKRRCIAIKHAQEFKCIELGNN